MIGEDHRSQAVLNFNRLISTKIDLKSKQDELEFSENIVKEKQVLIDDKE